VWVDEGKNDAACGGEGSEDGVIREILPELEITDSLTSPERLKILKTRYPEFEPLSKEFVNLQSIYHDLALAADAFPRNTPLKMDNTAQVHAMEETPPVVLKYRTLSAYLGTLSMYFVLLTSTHAEVDNKITAMPPAKLRDHSIMDTLLRCRELWDKVKDIPVLETKDLKQASSSTLNENIAPIIDSGSPGNAINDVNNRSKKPKEKSKKPRKSKAQKALEAAQAAAAAKRLEEMENKIRTLSALEDQIRKIPKATGLQRSPSPSTDSDFGERTILTENELLEKSQRKQSLRFYTSQITQKSQKRDVAGRHAGGDTDIPHRERLRDRQARLNAEGESRGKKGPKTKGGDALGGESDEEDRQAAAELRKANSADEDDNSYYNLIGAQQAAKKARKQAAADAAKAAEKGGPFRIQEDEFEGGKRGLSYAIAKNKGLAPRRKKEVRNPRVKKRLKFEEKKRKLGSIRAVWKGGEGKGGYKGELTGIKTGLVRGVKL
jgi:U3 small nucleolar RNA-associated protein 3